jgi:hypothetical protein
MNRPSRRWFAILTLFGILATAASAEPLISPTWGFSIDLPEGYALVGGDGSSRFSFASETGARVDLIAYSAGRYESPDEAASQAAEKLGAKTEASAFSYRGKKAVLMSLAFDAGEGPVEGWGLCVELAPQASARGAGRSAPTLLALAYGPAADADLDGFHRSALDSIAPTPADKRAPGPLSAFAFPTTGRKTVRIAGLDAAATIDGSDAEAARSLVDREFAVLTHYADSPLWKEAWSRFYRFIYRDSYERLADIALAVERALSAAGTANAEGLGGQGGSNAGRRLTERALAWVQGFAYERNLMGSDFVDLVSAATEGSGDCDSRALLLAVVLMHANIDAAIMVSRDYGHAMGLVSTEGAGARFEYGGVKWVVAETTAKVALGLIGKTTADPKKWLGILLQ